MKETFGIFIAAALTLVSLFLWGRVFLQVLLHPIYAFERLVLPVLVIMLIVWLATYARGRSGRQAKREAQIIESVQRKSASEQLEVSLNENGQWSDVAVKAARNSFKNRSLSAQVDAVAEVRANRG
jgi:hypothetical protein